MVNVVPIHALVVMWIVLFLAPQKVRGKVKRKVHLSYPVDLLGLADTFEANITRDRLTCFGNRDHGVPTYRETLLCMVRMPFGHSCHSIWGSRSVVVDVVGSAEFFKVTRTPPGSLFDEHISVNATRWMELTAASSYVHQREVRQAAAEPLYLCARSNDWTGAPAHFHISFRHGYLRERDRELCHSKFLIHVLLVVAVSSVWLIPYLVALVVATLTFSHGIKFFIAVLLFSCCIVAMTPLMLTKKNRHVARLYIGYFFTRVQAEETRMVIRQRLPVFQALFFSSVLVCVGSAGAYIIYTYCGIDRETRNAMLRVTMGVAASWFVFFVCRSFERFCVDWMWIPISIGLAQLLDAHMNPLSRDETIVCTLLLSLVIRMALHRGVRAVRLRGQTMRNFAFSVPQRLNKLPLRVPQSVGRVFSSFRTLLRRRLRIYGDHPTADETAAAAAVAAVAAMDEANAGGGTGGGAASFLEEAAAAVLGGGIGDDDQENDSYDDDGEGVRGDRGEETLSAVVDEEEEEGREVAASLLADVFLGGDGGGFDGRDDGYFASAGRILSRSSSTGLRASSSAASITGVHNNNNNNNSNYPSKPRQQLWETLQQEGGIDTPPDIIDGAFSIAARHDRGPRSASITSLTDTLDGQARRSSSNSLHRQGSSSSSSLHRQGSSSSRLSRIASNQDHATLPSSQNQHYTRPPSSALSLSARSSSGKLLSDDHAEAAAAPGAAAAAASAASTMAASMVEAAAEVASMGGELLEIFLGASYDCDEDLNEAILATDSSLLLPTAASYAAANAVVDDDDDDDDDSEDDKTTRGGIRHSGGIHNHRLALGGGGRFNLSSSRLTESQRSLNGSNTGTATIVAAASAGGGIYHNNGGVSVSPRKQQSNESTSLAEADVTRRMFSVEARNRLALAESVGIDLSALALLPVLSPPVDLVSVVGEEGAGGHSNSVYVNTGVGATYTHTAGTVVGGQHTHDDEKVEHRREEEPQKQQQQEGNEEEDEDLLEGNFKGEDEGSPEEEEGSPLTVNTKEPAMATADHHSHSTDTHTYSGNNDTTKSVPATSRSVSSPPSLPTPPQNRQSHQDHTTQPSHEHHHHQQLPAASSSPAVPALLWPAEQYTHIVGSMALPICALGPLTIDGFSVWIPMATLDTHLLECVRASVRAFGDHAGGVVTHLFDPVSESTSYHATLSLPTFAAAAAVQSWATRVNTKEILHSIVLFGDESSSYRQQHSSSSSSSSGYTSPRRLSSSSSSSPGVIKFRAVGRDVQITLKLLRQSSSSSTSTLSPMDRLILALLEQFPEASIADLGSEFQACRTTGSAGLCVGGDGDRYQAGAAAVAAAAPSVGVEAMLSLHTLASLGINSVDDFVEAANLLKMKNDSAYKRRLVQAAASVLSALRLDTSLATEAVASTAEVEIVTVKSSSAGKITLSANSPTRLAARKKRRRSSRSLLREERVEEDDEEEEEEENGIVPGDDDDDDESDSSCIGDDDSIKEDEEDDDVELVPLIDDHEETSSSSDDETGTSGGYPLENSSKSRAHRGYFQQGASRRKHQRAISLLVTVPALLPDTDVILRSNDTLSSQSPPHIPASPSAAAFPSNNGVTAANNAAATCLHLLLGEMGASGVVEHAPSRVFASVIAAAYLSLIVETANSEFFRALRKASSSSQRRLSEER